MSTINSNGTMVFGNASGGSVTIAPANNTSTNYTLTIPSVSGSVALVDSQAFTGTPTAPTAIAGTNNTQLATTAMVHSAITNDLNVTGTAPMYACRAWVNFNGTGTVAIRASGNVSSITDNGVGTYTINFTTAMSDANYVAVAGQDLSVANGFIALQIYLTTSVKLMIASNGAMADPNIATVSIFR